MRLSESEVRALILLTSSEQPVHPRDLRADLALQRETISRVITRLEEKGLAERENGQIVLAGTAPAQAFKRLYFAHRASPLPGLLSGRRVELLSRLDRRPKSLKTLAGETGIPSDTIYYYLKGFLRVGIVASKKEGKSFLYSFNCILWPELKGFVTSLLEHQVLRLVPREALLIKSYKDSVLFKSLRPQDATLTSFSAYGEHQVMLGLRDNYYTLPKRELSPGEIFIHSLDSAESISQRLYCILFYLKNKGALQDIQHPMLKDIKAVLMGRQIKGYPTLEEIKEQVELYGIEPDIKA